MTARLNTTSVDLSTIEAIQPVEDDRRYCIEILAAGSPHGRLLLAGDTSIWNSCCERWMHDTPAQMFHWLVEVTGKARYPFGDDLVTRWLVTDEYTPTGARVLRQPVLLAHLFPGNPRGYCNAEQALTEYRRARTQP